MRDICRTVIGVGSALGLTLIWSVNPDLAASAWWVAVPSRSAAISAVASDQGATTLAISRGRAGRYTPATGQFLPLPRPSGMSAQLDAAVAVAAVGREGVIAYRQGQLAAVSESNQVCPVTAVEGDPTALALSGPSGEIVAVATSSGLFSGRLGRPLTRDAAGRGQALIAPPKPGRDWLALVGGRLWESQGGRHWTRAEHAPAFGPETHALTELATGAILVGQPGGLIWRGYQGRWYRALQLLPYGGLGGVPRVTALVADSATSAYLATDGFGTLLTPDGGFSWYRAPPPDAAVTALATVGPVFSDNSHGLVVALAAGRIFLHRLQPFPAPPAYTPGGAAAELAGTAAVTLVAAGAVVLLLWLLNRRRRRRSV
ncbi:MAG: hypothetical protein ACRENX_11545 [Candidatus Dormibacteria bacterium]